MKHMKAFEQTKSLDDYHPLIISLNYTENKKQYAMISYGIFTKNGKNEINGARIEKQVVLINGLPFEIKSIYGLDSEHATDGTTVGKADKSD